MASQNGLVHSFWEWVRRSERRLRRARSKSIRAKASAFPTAYPTSVVACSEAVQSLAPLLKGTTFEKKATYWKDLFAQIVSEGWKEVA